MRMVLTAGVLCAALLFAVTAAVHAATGGDLDCIVIDQQDLVGE